MKRKVICLLGCLALLGIFTALGVLAGSLTGAPAGDVDLMIYAQRYSFDPPIIRLNKGDRVSINLVTRDVTHGFFLEGYDIDAKIRPGDSSDDSVLLIRHPSKHDDFQEVDRIIFTAERTGKFRFRCSQTCGYMHPFMQGEMIVSPNYELWGGIGLVTGVAVSAMAFFVFMGTPGSRGGAKLVAERSPLPNEPQREAKGPEK
ncbi:hypothetical protein LCGC14_0302200 [marine sediment metagenome]|uniref:Cytochrome oxidase subunit II copper A binding domain-containing protein n=1 Tax=marine sediment metagenome TaxID=412755 RepID=A0A0F9U704_9ZZZZ|nr:hypothetical protein [Phycisphaerae bacterium]HDZ45161.1 hypothetical protein [Phycisphaerae bacterium]